MKKLIRKGNKKMKTKIRLNFLLIFFLLTIITPFSILHASEFNAKVIPSLIDSEMDGWYKIPPNSGPQIHGTSRVFHDQTFSLLIFFRGYTANKNNNIHIRYDIQLYDPQGNSTDVKAFDLLAYQGFVKNLNALILNQQCLDIGFTEKDLVGKYNIKITAYDKISNKSFISETPIELIAFTLPKDFLSKEEASKWMMEYYKKPMPIKAISAIKLFVQFDQKWLNKNLNILTYFKEIFSNNPFLLKNIVKEFDSFSLDEKKKLLLILAISGDKNLESLANENELKEIYTLAKNIKFPDMDREINSALQLDILWSEFFATGKYKPIKKIVSALALEKYKGTLEKMKSGEIKNISKEIKQKAYLEATYKAATWSLISNCKQIPLVFKYCIFIYENENLDKNIKMQLESILRVTQKELQKNLNKGGQQEG
jgi:hypothetical protein